MALPPTSRLQFFSADGSQLDAPAEWAPCEIRVDADPGKLGDLRLVRNGEALELAVKVVDGRSCVVGKWTRAGAGHYDVTLTQDHAIETSSYEVAPEKLGGDAVRELLIDLQRRLPATIAIALQQTGALAGLQLVAPQHTTMAEELNRLARACQGTSRLLGLAHVLQAIARGPHRILRTEDIWTRREHARRIDPTRLHQAYARQKNLTNHVVPLQVPERRVQYTADVYENRLLRTYHDQVDSRLRVLCRAASRLKDETISEKAESLLWELTRARREASFLDDVSELTEPPSRLTMVLLRRSEYRAALEGFLEFRRSALVQLEEPLLAAPLTNLPKLYESWGTLEVIATFLSLALPLGYKVKTERLIKRRADRVWVEVLKDGQPAVELEHPSGQRAKLIPQRSYPASPAGLHSVSFAKRPDVAIEVTDPMGRTRIWIFDPKYKLDSEVQSPVDSGDSVGPKGSPKPQDINAMHAYRDAIRDAEDQFAVRYAAILYPGATKWFGSEIAALQSHPLAKDILGALLADVLSRALSPPLVGVPNVAV
jgi:hypothetical protein